MVGFSTHVTFRYSSAKFINLLFIFHLNSYCVSRIQFSIRSFGAHFFIWFSRVKFGVNHAL
jgi:hypothetical protein